MEAQKKDFSAVSPNGFNQSLVLSIGQANLRINIYLVSVDKMLCELELRFSGKGQEILCALGLEEEAMSLSDVYLICT